MNPRRRVLAASVGKRDHMADSSRPQAGSDRRSRLCARATETSVGYAGGKDSACLLRRRMTKRGCSGGTTESQARAFHASCLLPSFDLSLARNDAELAVAVLLSTPREYSPCDAAVRRLVKLAKEVCACRPSSGCPCRR